MYVESLDDLDNLTDEQLWKVAVDTANEVDIRHEAIRQWLFPADDSTELDNEERIAELRQRATPIEDDDIEEDNIEDFDGQGQGPYFDGAGNLIVEVNGLRYLIEDDGEQSDMHLAD